MNRRIRPPLELDAALLALIANLTPAEQEQIREHRAKLIIIDGEAWFIDMAGGTKHD